MSKKVNPIDLKKKFAKDKAPKADPKYINVPNICFSLTKKDDKREVKFKKQRLKRGFDDSETWSLKNTLADFILPRLKRHRELIQDVIMDTHNLYQDIDDAIFAFETVQKSDKSEEISEKDWKRYDKGMKAFGRVFMRLWW
jgi:hypothetical protein